MAETKGLRFNAGKPRYSLVSPVALRMLVDVLEFGATKYDKHNWANGMDWEAQTLDSMLRHIQAWRGGEDNDPETGLPHVSHILCNAMFLAHFVGTNTGNDDRHFKEEVKKWNTSEDPLRQHNKTTLKDPGPVLKAAPLPLEIPRAEEEYRKLFRMAQRPGLPSAISPSKEPTQGS